jgi:hypothetical protein
VGQKLEFAISATDPDQDALTYSALLLPTGATFIVATGVFSWTPSSDQASSHIVTFTVSDGLLTNSEDVTITVNPVVVDPITKIAITIKEIKGLNLPKGTENSLISKMDSATKSLEKGKPTPAVNQLEACINEVQAQRGKKIPMVKADELIASIRAIISQIQSMKW